MDNLTHSLVGIAIAETALPFCKPKRSPRFRAWAWLVSMFSNNFPDLDLLYCRITEGPVGYLLHHRGHTHTLIFALVQGFIVYYGARVLMRFKKISFTPQENGWLMALALLGGFVHIGLDGLNSYGIHPFWPFDNRWFYGDALFIIEPWLWIFLLIGAISVTRAKIRAVFLGCLIFAVLLIWKSGQVPNALATGLSLSAFIFLSLVIWTKRAVMGLSVLFSLAAIALFLGMSFLAKQELNERIEGTREIILRPEPGNPFCWNYLILQRASGSGEIQYREGMAQAGLNSASCRPVEWEGQKPLSAALLSQLATEHCGVAAFLRFSRAPYIEERGNDYLLSDVRFSRSGRSFSSIVVPKVAVTCPQWVPPWLPPAAKFLDGSQLAK